jgi:hypothetical protein
VTGLQAASTWLYTVKANIDFLIYYLRHYVDARPKVTMCILEGVGSNSDGDDGPS